MVEESRTMVLDLGWTWVLPGELLESQQPGLTQVSGVWVREDQYQYFWKFPRWFERVMTLLYSAACWDCTGLAGWVYELFWAFSANEYSFSKCLCMWENLVRSPLSSKSKQGYRRIANTYQLKLLWQLPNGSREIEFSALVSSKQGTALLPLTFLIGREGRKQLLINSLYSKMTISLPSFSFISIWDEGEARKAQSTELRALWQALDVPLCPLSSLWVSAKILE